ncbi:LLM class flavin-dependent oxidoreductase [Streptomyces sp. enrichment culture]|uniref:LLM class flavin-dependent oxidoreductase n=1 Tax=Streptomyces sp. enrichment culture TaxID=1795815 RepID=UPI003F546C33
MSPAPRPARPVFGIMTPPSQAGYDDLVRVWREADGVPEIEHAWLYDHLMPVFGDPGGPTFEGWTPLAALAARTRLGVMVTGNRFRPPAVLAKIATTVDIVSGGRLDFGIGVGSRPRPPEAWREYAAHGLPFQETARAVASLAEACTLIKRLWTEEQPFGFHGEHHRLTGAFGNPKPVQCPHPPVLVGGRSSATLRVAAEHADLWNVPGGDLDDVLRRSALLDRYCAGIGRDPASLVRSLHLPVDTGRPDAVREAVGEALGAGFTHIVPGLPAPLPEGIARWVAEEVIRPSVR